MKKQFTIHTQLKKGIEIQNGGGGGINLPSSQHNSRDGFIFCLIMDLVRLLSVGSSTDVPVISLGYSTSANAYQRSS